MKKQSNRNRRRRPQAPTPQPHPAPLKMAAPADHKMHDILKRLDEVEVDANGIHPPFRTKASNPPGTSPMADSLAKLEAADRATGSTSPSRTMTIMAKPYDILALLEAVDRALESTARTLRTLKRIR